MQNVTIFLYLLLIFLNIYKTMKVLFLKHVVNVGKEWEVKEVKPWYAVNMLFPKGLAVELTPEVEKNMKAKQKKEETHRRELIENRFELADTLNMKKFNFTLKTGANQKVYGAIWEKDIIQAVKKKYKINLSKKHINMPDGHIKKLGESIIFIKFWKDAISKVFITINEEK